MGMQACVCQCDMLKLTLFFHQSASAGDTQRCVDISVFYLFNLHAPFSTETVPVAF